MTNAALSAGDRWDGVRAAGETTADRNRDKLQTTRDERWRTATGRCTVAELSSCVHAPAQRAMVKCDRTRLRGVQVAPASAFSAGTTTAAAMRISLGAIADAKQLETAIRLVASLVSHPRLTTATTV